MKLRSRLLMTAAGVVLTSAAAQAADVPTLAIAPPPPPPAVEPPPAGGPYVTIFGGFLDIPPVDAEIVFGGTQLIFVEPDLGFRAGGALGFAMGNFGVEFEGTYGRTHLGFWDTAPIGGNGGPITDPDAYAHLVSLMGNLQLNLGTGSFRPFVAVGGGAVRLALTIPDGTWPAEVYDADWTWGAQVMAGVNVALSDAVSLGARYRYQYVGPTSFTDGDSDPIDVFGFGTHGFELTLTIGGR